MECPLQVKINLQYRLAPFGVIGVCLSLMQQDSLDDAIPGGDLRHTHQTSIGVAAILVEDVVHPVLFLAGNERRVPVFVEECDGATLHCHRHDAYPHILGHHIEQGAPEIVGGPQTGIRTAQRGNGLTPCAQHTPVAAVCGRHTEETVAHRQVLWLNGCLPCHI